MTMDDYDAFVEFEKEIVEEMYIEMQDFIQNIKHLLDNKIQKSNN